MNFCLSHAASKCMCGSPAQLHLLPIHASVVDTTCLAYMPLAKSFLFPAKSFGYALLSRTSDMHLGCRILDPPLVYDSLLTATKDIKGASVESNKYCVSIHYRNVATEDQGRVREVVDEVLKATTVDLKLTEGKMVYEVRPPTLWNKGDAVLYLLEHLGFLDLKKVFPIYIGDDRTDEDAFKALLDKECGAGILVSETSKETSASYSLQNPMQVMRFLDMLVQEERQK